MTLVTVVSSDGSGGRCDAKCYDAKSPGCDCVCGGANHGAGLKKAEENTREYCEEWIKEYKKSHNITDGHSEINQDIFQMKLF